MKLCILFFLWLFFVAKTLANPYVPESSETVIADWTNKPLVSSKKEVIKSEEDVIKTAEAWLDQAKAPGHSYLYDMAANILKPWIKKDSQSSRLWLLWARIKQHKHDFTDATRYLNKVLDSDPKNINANLLMARIRVVQEEYSLAKESCLSLLSRSDVLTVSACLLDVASQQENINHNYEQLKQSVDGKNIAGEQKRWVSMILSDVALRLGKWEEAEHWLDSNFTEGDVNFLVHWADVKLQLVNFYQVKKILSNIVDKNSSVEDALLLRLALAEKQINEFENKEQRFWQDRIKSRILLREKRQDLHHASDLTVFYLDIEPNAKKALYWARVNWQQAREYKDRQLLKRAEKKSLS